MLGQNGSGEFIRLCAVQMPYAFHGVGRQLFARVPSFASEFLFQRLLLYCPCWTFTLYRGLFSAEFILYFSVGLYARRSGSGLIYFARSTRIGEKPRRLCVYKRSATGSESRLDIRKGSNKKAQCRPRAIVATHRCAVWKLSKLVPQQFTMSRTGPKTKLSTPPARYDLPQVVTSTTVNCIHTNSDRHVSRAYPLP